ncbi:MAG TPA: glutathione S-transferase family protein [Leucothrix mucor]|uniref:glutathione transferase n=1 Tax=Leucothrix mucor TaxID=45248 RepID=A0A7V2T202_LEUMU|nr:glutathione S-transferase family protein [Leucothrix mucor]
MAKPKLVSFKICPFVQRSVILLKEKNIDFDIAYINLDEPPEWFLALSPTGKVPILEVDGKVLFESAIISEYLDEVNPPSLHPANPLEKAQNRAWMEFTSPLYMAFFKLMMSKTKKAGAEVIIDTNKQLATLDKIKVNAPWFNGDDFSMMDISIAPLFMRLAFLKKHYNLDLLDGRNNLQAWSDKLLARESVINSVVDDFEDILLMRIKGAESFLAL